MKRVTPGRLTSLWVVLRTLSKLGGEADVQEVLSLAERSGLRSGGLPIDDGFALAADGGFVLIRENSVALQELGSDALALASEDEPPASALRLFLSVLLLRDPPHWVAYWQGSPTSLEDLLGESDRQLLMAAGMLPPDASFLSHCWWRALAKVPLPESASALRQLIGTAGEELSLAYEKTRLESEGFEGLAKQVRWVARESAAYGFDIASFVGKSGRGANPEDPLAIEVKSVAFPAVGTFPLHVTIHEWETARELGVAYLFHLWDGVSPRPDVRARTSAPRVMTSDMVTRHLAQNPTCSGICGWESCYLEIPLAEIAGRD